MAEIITLDEYRDYDDLPSPAENEDQINAAIKLATSYIEKKTGCIFEIADIPSPSPHDVVEILDGKGTNRIYTHNAPIVTVSKIEYWDGSAWEEYDSVAYPYSWKEKSNIVYFTSGHCFCQGWQNIRVTFEYGFTDTLPDDLKYACYLITKHIIAKAERLGITSQADGEQSFSYDHSIPKEAITIIRLYRTVW